MKRDASPTLTVGVTIALISGVTVGNVGANVMPALLDDFGARFSMSMAAAGGVAAAQLLATALTTLLLAGRAARPGRARMARIGLVVGAAGCLGAGAAPDAVSLLLSNLVMGGGLGAVYAAATAALAAAGDADRASGVTIFGSALITSFLLVVVPSANDAWGSGSGFFLVALACVPTYWLVRNLPDSPSERAGCPRDSNDTLARVPPGTLLLGAAGLLAAIGQGAWSYVAKLGREHTHLSPSAVSSILAVSGVIAIAGAAVGPLAAVRWGRMRSMAAFVVLEALTMCLALVTASPAMFAVVAVLWQVCQLAVLVQLLAAAAVRDSSGRWVAALSGASALGAGVGPLVTGAAIDFTGVSMLSVLLAAGVVLASLPLLRMAAQGAEPEPEPDAEPVA